MARFVKETLKAKHFFIYLDDIVILDDDKGSLKEWQWRIMQFLWYKLGLECNSKRQIFKLGRNKTERGIDFAGYVFRHGYTLVRKRIKIEALMDRPIEILDFQVRPSEKKPGTDYLKMQIRFDGKKRFVGGGYQFLCEVLKQIDKSNLPLQTVIRNKRGYYFEGTIDED